MKLLVILTVLLGTASVALAIPPGAKRGVFIKQAGAGELAAYVKVYPKSVFCIWDKGHVKVHFSLRNRAVEHVTMTIVPRYTIRGGGTHGTGIANYQNKGFDAGGFRAIWLDAGEPKGVPTKTPISGCFPTLVTIKSG